mmetsp:Transcript_109355/g.172351  ORF Transcript_109355/g.172351 Transcript_109355/m.172351 type:complete len:207 (-) Transcript_109355:989-1609(-)
MHNFRRQPTTNCCTPARMNKEQLNSMLLGSVRAMSINFQRLSCTLVMLDARSRPISCNYSRCSALEISSCNLGSSASAGSSPSAMSAWRTAFLSRPAFPKRRNSKFAPGPTSRRHSSNANAPTTPTLFSSKSSSKYTSLDLSRLQRRLHRQVNAFASSTQPASPTLFRRSRSFRRVEFRPKAFAMAVAVTSVSPGNCLRKFKTRSL